MGWAEFLPIIATIIVAIIGTLGTVYAKRITRRQDEATVRKLEAEAEEKRIVARSSEVDIARRLLEDVQTIMDKRTTEYERLLSDNRARAEADLAAVTERMALMEERERAFMASFSDHIAWDKQALAELRKRINQEYPEPPPVIGLRP